MTTPLLCLAVLAAEPTPLAVRGCALAPAAVAAAEAHGHDPRLLLAVAYVESRWTPGAVGSRGELGAWQTLPRYGDGSADAAGRILARWRARAGGDVRVALRAYNAGRRGLRGVAGVRYAARVVALSRRWR